MPVIAEFFARETQDFASLLGGNAFTVSDIIACACGMDVTRDATFCVSTGHAPLSG